MCCGTQLEPSFSQCVASWDPFSGFVRPKLLCRSSAALFSSVSLWVAKLTHAHCTKAVTGAPVPTKAVAPRWSGALHSLLCVQKRNEGRFHLVMSLIKQRQLIPFQPLATCHFISRAVKCKLYLKHSRKSTHVV